MTSQIEVGIEKMNRGHWLKVVIPYHSSSLITATILDPGGETLKILRLETGNNMIDIESIDKPSINIKVETSFETILKELNLRS